MSVYGTSTPTTRREVFLGSVVEPLRPPCGGLVLEFPVDVARICLRDNPTLLNPVIQHGAGIPSCVTPSTDNVADIVPEY